MTPEARLDTINAHFADWNWRKLCGMGMFLLFSIFTRVAEHLTGVTLQSRLQNAQRQCALHTERFGDLHASLGENDTTRVSV